MIKTYAMDSYTRKRRKAIVGAILVGLFVWFITIRTAERVGFARGYNAGFDYAMGIIVD